MNIYLSSALCAAVWNTHTQSTLFHSYTQRPLVQSSWSSQYEEERREKHVKSLSSSVWLILSLAQSWRDGKEKVDRFVHFQFLVEVTNTLLYIGYTVPFHKGIQWNPYSTTSTLDVHILHLNVLLLSFEFCRGETQLQFDQMQLLIMSVMSTTL